MTHLKEGDKAPDFLLNNQDEIKVALSDFKGSRLIIFFYPKDNTPGCTAEACNLNENYADLTAKGFKIIGVSADTEKKHQNFIAKYGFQYDLLADTERKMLNAYGVWGPKKFMGREFDGIHRTTFIISEGGVIEKVIKQVDTKNHTEQILKELENNN